MRPFWTKAALHLGLLSGSVLLVAILGMFTLLRATGADSITPLDLALPWRWERIGNARADAFRQNALRSLQGGDYATVLLALTTAEEIAPGTNLETGLLALRLSEQRNQYVLTDQLHHRLVQGYPEHRLRINVNYRDALLISGRWPTLAQLSLEQLDPEASGTGPWLRTLVLAIDMLPDASGFSETHRQQVDALPAVWRGFIQRILDETAPGPDFPSGQIELFATIAIEHAARTGDTSLAADAFGALIMLPDVFRDLRLQNRYRLRFPNSTRDPSALRLTLVDFADSPSALQQLLSDALLSSDPVWLAAIANKLPAKVPDDCAGDLWLASTLLGQDQLRAKAEHMLQETGRVQSEYFQFAASHDPGASGWSEWIAVVPCSREMLLALAELRPATR